MEQFSPVYEQDVQPSAQEFSEPLIRFEGVTKVYPPDSLALYGMEFTIHPGEFISIIGKSGAGKTTLIRLLLGEEAPNEGTVLFAGQNVHQIEKGKLPAYRRNIGAIFQDYKLLDLMTVRENIAYVMEVVGAPDTIIRQTVEEVLEVVRLGDKGHCFPAQLSDGEKQRVAIARALVNHPQVLLADEPTGNLDPYHTHNILQLLRRINEIGTTVILTSHNKDLVNKLGRRVLTLEKGKLVRDDPRGRFVM